MICEDLRRYEEIVEVEGEGGTILDEAGDEVAAIDDGVMGSVGVAVGCMLCDDTAVVVTG